MLISTLFITSLYSVAYTRIDCFVMAESAPCVKSQVNYMLRFMEQFEKNKTIGLVRSNSNY